MMRIWKTASIGLAFGLAAGGSSLFAEPPRLAENLEEQAAESPLDAALKDEAFIPNAPANPGYYCPPRQFGLPPMIGDFFPGYTGGARRTSVLDSAFIVADDLDAPNPLPSASQVLSITEPGPVGIFRSSVMSVQDIQEILRAGGTLPTPTSAGSVNADATLTTAITIGEIQSLLASTPGVAFDIIPLVAPPGSYLAGVDAVFQGANPGGGTTTFDSAASGALLQGGADTLNGGDDLDAFYFYNYVLTVGVPTPSAGTAGVGRSRIAENGTTTPQDRIFFDYGYFDGVGMIAGNNSIHRYNLGFETTFADGAGSFELRVPFASTVDDLIFEDGRTNSDKLNLGNLTTYLKFLLQETQTTGVAGGLGLAFPTADGFSVNFVDGGRLIDIENKSYHLQPFVSGYYAPDNRFFTQAFAQLDFDLNGNPVEINSTGSGLRNAGRLDDATFLFLDWSVGYWMIRGDDAPVLPTSSFGEHGDIRQAYHQIGLAPTMELHYARSLESADTVSSNAIQVGNFADDVETLTLVLGTHLEIGQDTNIALGYATGLMGGNDKPFDGAFRLTVNRFFGRK